MKITFNKAAYCVKLPSLEEAGNVYKNYIDVFFILKKEKRITEGIEFFGEMIDTQQWITSQGHTIYDLKKCWGKYGVDRQRMLLQMFSMMASGKSSPTPSKIVKLDDTKFQIPAEERTMLISLETARKYAEPFLEGVLEDQPLYRMLNISRADHIEVHRIPLGIRIYQPNPKHKKVETFLGKGLKIAPMTLENKEAQELLNKAIQIDKERTLYAVKDGKCYALPEHEPGKKIYHGYELKNPSDLIKRKLGL